MQEEYYNYYASAPVFVWLAPEGEGLKDYFEKTHPLSHVMFYQGDDKASALVEALEWAENKYNSLSNEIVKQTFDTYDADGSGTIDKNELAKLSKELGHSLSDRELEDALKDLDTNEDGVIDFSEFQRWWFSGFKCRSNHNRSMIKIKK